MRVEAPATGGHIFGADHGVGGRVLSFGVHQEGRVEDLHGQVGVHGGGDVGDAVQVVVDEAAQADVVLHRAAARPPGDEEFEVGQAEGVLHIDEHQGDAGRILRRWRDGVLLRPGAGLTGAGFVIHLPDLADFFGVEMGGKR